MSIIHDAAIAQQAYVREYADQLFGRLFYGFQTAQLATIHEGIKGEKLITEWSVGSNLARRWAKSFDPTTVGEFKPVTLKTVLNKVDFSIVPTEYESSYLGQFRKKGQDMRDWPFQAYIMDETMKVLNQEFEVACWQGAEEASPSAGDYLRQTFDGYLTLIAKAITAGDITPVATGAITSSNAVAKFRDLWAAVDPVYKTAGVDIFVPYALYDAYRINYKDTYKIDPAYVEITSAGYRGIAYELGNGNATIIPVHGMGSSGRVVITPRSNLVLGIDSPSDVMFNVKEEIRELRLWMDFRMGAQILMKRNGILVVNDQA